MKTQLSTTPRKGKIKFSYGRILFLVALIFLPNFAYAEISTIGESSIVDGLTNISHPSFTLKDLARTSKKTGFQKNTAFKPNKRIKKNIFSAFLEKITFKKRTENKSTPDFSKFTDINSIDHPIYSANNSKYSPAGNSLITDRLNNVLYADGLLDDNTQSQPRVPQNIQELPQTMNLDKTSLTTMPAPVSQAKTADVSAILDVKEILLMRVVLNGQDAGVDAVILQTPKDALISKEDLQNFDILIDQVKAKPYDYLGRPYYAIQEHLHSIYRIDQALNKIHITLATNLFKGSIFNYKAKSTVPLTEPATGAFVNYDSSVTTGGNNSAQYGSVFEGGFFGKKGVGITNFMFNKGQGHSTITRLNTYWQKDDPEKMRTVTYGDIVGNAGLWGASTMIGGVQWSTNFATQPDFATSWLPNAHGQAVLPSSLDLYVNNTLVSKNQITPGAFRIDNIPVVSGSGNVNVVVTDILGRQQVINIPYFTTGELLKPGLHDYSYSVGLIRTNYGQNNLSYSKPAFEATDSLGVSPDFTRQWHLEVESMDKQAFGYGGNKLNKWGMSKFVIAGSRNSNGFGGMINYGTQYAAPKNRYTIMLNLEMDSPYFSKLGSDNNQLAPSLISQLSLSIPIKNGNNLGFSYTRQSSRGNTQNDANTSSTSGSNANIFGVSYQTRIFKDWSLAFAGTYSSGNGTNNRAFSLSLTKTFQNQTNLSLMASQDSTGTGQSVAISNNSNIYSKFGYNLEVDTGNRRNYRGSIAKDTDYGSYSLAAEHSEGANIYRGQSSGGVVYIDKGIYFGKKTLGSFGLVKVPKYKDVKIQLSNLTVAHTDKNGNAILPALLPYQENKIGIDVSDLPLDTKIEEIEKIVKPYARTGVIIPFSVKKSRGLLMQVTRKDGSALPPDTVVLVNRKDYAYIATEGTLYITEVDLEKTTEIIAPFGERSCLIMVDLKKIPGIDLKDPVIDIGKIACEMIDTPPNLPGEASLAPEATSSIESLLTPTSDIPSTPFVQGNADIPPENQKTKPPENVIFPSTAQIQATGSSEVQGLETVLSPTDIDLSNNEYKLVEFGGNSYDDFDSSKDAADILLERYLEQSDKSCLTPEVEELSEFWDNIGINESGCAYAIQSGGKGEYCDKNLSAKLKKWKNRFSVIKSRQRDRALDNMRSLGLLN